MIKITDKHKCCGCNACVQKCPMQCITMQEDKEGFLYPVIDNNLCATCGLCEKVCPIINQAEEQIPLRTLVAKNKNEEIRKASSSGGIFTLYAEKTIKKGGIVYGAIFNEKWEVRHSAVETIEGLNRLRGSKYVQSKIGNCYQEAEKRLKEGREVLFTGTPCQIAGLKRYLRKEYKNLTTIDVVCHGVPSPRVWREYLKERCQELGISINDIKEISFRDKVVGWKRFSLSLKTDTLYTYKPLDNDTFMRCFLNDLCLRPSCYTCPARKGKSGSDITLADLWGCQEICPDLDDDKGLSLVLVRNAQKEIKLPFCKDIEYSEALKHNPAIENSAIKPNKRDKFFKVAIKKGVYKATEDCLHKSSISIFVEKVLWNIKNRLLK